MKLTESRVSSSGRVIKKPRYAESEPSDIDDDDQQEESKSLSSIEKEEEKEVLTESDEDDFGENEYTVIPNSDNSVDEYDEEDSDNSDECEKGLGKRKLMDMVSGSKQKFKKKAAVHRRGIKIAESSEEDESEEEEIPSKRKRRKIVEEEDSQSEREKTIINTAKNTSKNMRSLRTTRSQGRRPAIDNDDEDNTTAAATASQVPVKLRVLQVWFIKDKYIDFKNETKYTVQLFNDTSIQISELEAKLNCPKKLHAFNNN